jgi:hypothetical protein
VEGQAIVEKVSPESPGFKEVTLISFDIPDRNKTRRTAIYRFLNGRSDTKIVDGEPKTYIYPGLLDEGGFRIGQSVFLLPPDLATRLIQKLTELKINHLTWNVLLQD